MRNALRLFAIPLALAAVGLAEDWSGRLLDATCDQEAAKAKAATCDATSATTVFAFQVGGKVYKLDTAGNTKAATAIRSRGDRAADPAKATEIHAIMAKITGSEKDGAITVETVELQ